MSIIGQLLPEQLQLRQFLGGNGPVGKCFGGNCPGENYSRFELSGLEQWNVMEAFRVGLSKWEVYCVPQTSYGRMS